MRIQSPSLIPFLLLILGASLAPARPASAQDTEAMPDTSYLAGESEGAVLGMTLDQAQRLAAENSPSLKAARAAVRSARGARMREAGAFDPVVTASDQRISTDTPTSSPFAPSELRERSLAAGVNWISPIGSTLAFSLTQSTIETNAPFTTLPRERHAGARVDFVQPLLKGFGPAAARGELRAADRDLAGARRRFDQARADLDADVEIAYWELYAAERDLAVQRFQRQRAALFARDQILRSKAGASGPGAVAAARTFLAEQEVQLLDARLQRRATADRLSAVLGQSAQAQGTLHCLDEPPPPATLEPLDQVMERARKGNPVIQAATQDVAASLARFRRASRNAWPSLDAFGGYGGAGLAGTGQVITFGGTTAGANFDTGFGDAWNDVWKDHNPDWNFGLRVTVPVGWRADRGERERQRAGYERAQASLQSQTLAIENAVRNAHREAESSQAALRATRDLVAAAREQERIGRLEFQAGRATAYDLVGVEADLARAELRESQVLVRVGRAMAELRRLTRLPSETTP